ncbi:MAG: type VI secretion system baseplate subunit TssK [Gammaproteobacteria bacterium]|nr:type VI secretion system baseplate subunit TssK [Gammaproteobacteria bacterium]
MMSWQSKVVWSEGLFVRPQHFQQQDRYIENLVESRYSGIHAYPWGIESMEIDREKLALGKFALRKCRAILPDGTVLNIPGHMPAPPAIDIPENLKNETVFLALPLQRDGAMETTDAEDTANQLTRYVRHEYEVTDNDAGTQNKVKLTLARPRLRLVLEHEERGEHACLGVARIKEVRTEKAVVLNEAYIPPAVNCRNVARLAGFSDELLGLLRTRGSALAEMISESGRGGSGEIRDYIFLQAVNRYEPLFAHFTQAAHLHPERFYRTCVEMAGELATFAHKDKRPLEFPPYVHEDLQGAFQPVIDDLRRSLATVVDQNVFRIPLEYRGSGKAVGLYVAQMLDINDTLNLRDLLHKAVFVLAVNARVETEVLHNEFPKQVKIGSVETINRMVRLNLPGIKIQVSPTAPRQIPFHSGFTYFELEQKSRYWEDLSSSGGIAIHIGDKYEDVELEFWAIKNQ